MQNGVVFLLSDFWKFTAVSCKPRNERGAGLNQKTGGMQPVWWTHLMAVCDQNATFYFFSSNPSCFYPEGITTHPPRWGFGQALKFLGYSQILNILLISFSNGNNIIVVVKMSCSIRQGSTRKIESVTIYNKRLIVQNLTWLQEGSSQTGDAHTRGFLFLQEASALLLTSFNCD